MKKNLTWLSAEETRAVAGDLGVTTAEVTEMERRLSARDLSFDLSPDSEDEEGYGPAAYLPAADADPAEQVEAEQWSSSTQDQLIQAMQRLDERSRAILQRRWMNEDKATLHELADEYGVSAERIRQIEAGAIAKLKGLLPAPA
jgi:RNA polymerase sigma-32 factor